MQVPALHSSRLRKVHTPPPRDPCHVCAPLAPAAQGAPAVQNAAHAKPAGVAFDNEAANLAGSMPSVAADPDMEE